MRKHGPNIMTQMADININNNNTCAKNNNFGPLQAQFTPYHSQHRPQPPVRPKPPAKPSILNLGLPHPPHIIGPDGNQIVVHQFLFANRDREKTPDLVYPLPPRPQLPKPDAIPRQTLLTRTANEIFGQTDNDFENSITLIEALYGSKSDDYLKHKRPFRGFKTIFGDFWATVFDEGIPAGRNLTLGESNPRLQISFSTPLVANGKWIQFYGPGSVLPMDKDVAVIGSLCSRMDAGRYSSTHSTATRWKNGNLRWMSSSTHVSDFTISIEFSRAKML